MSSRHRCTACCCSTTTTRQWISWLGVAASGTAMTREQATHVIVAGASFGHGTCGVYEKEVADTKVVRWSTRVATPTSASVYDGALE